MHYYSKTSTTAGSLLNLYLCSGFVYCLKVYLQKYLCRYIDTSVTCCFCKPAIPSGKYTYDPSVVVMKHLPARIKPILVFEIT